MENKDFVTYEYKTVAVKAKDKVRAADMYEAFGWEITSTAPSGLNGATLGMRRDRKQQHRRELIRLEGQAEETAQTLKGLQRAKTLGAKIFAYVFGGAATLVFGGGMCLCLLVTGSIPALAGGIALGLAGIVLCGINYPIYKKMAEKKTKQLLPVIDQTEEELANILEKGNGLLSADLI